MYNIVDVTHLLIKIEATTEKIQFFLILCGNDHILMYLIYLPVELAHTNDISIIFVFIFF